MGDPVKLHPVRPDAQRIGAFELSLTTTDDARSPAAAP